MPFGNRNPGTYGENKADPLTPAERAEQDRKDNLSTEEQVTEYYTEKAAQEKRVAAGKIAYDEYVGKILENERERSYDILRLLILKYLSESPNYAQKDAKGQIVDVHIDSIMMLLNNPGLLKREILDYITHDRHMTDQNKKKLEEFFHDKKYQVARSSKRRMFDDEIEEFFCTQKCKEVGEEKNQKARIERDRIYNKIFIITMHESKIINITYLNAAADFEKDHRPSVITFPLFWAILKGFQQNMEDCLNKIINGELELNFDGFKIIAKDTYKIPSYFDYNTRRWLEVERTNFDLEINNEKKWIQYKQDIFGKTRFDKRANEQREIMNYIKILRAINEYKTGDEPESAALALESAESEPAESAALEPAESAALEPAALEPAPLLMLNEGRVFPHADVSRVDDPDQGDDLEPAEGGRKRRTPRKKRRTTRKKRRTTRKKRRTTRKKANKRKTRRSRK